MNPQVLAMIAAEKAKYDEVFESSTRGKSAYILSLMALEHGSGGALAAAKLLLSMEHEQPFDFTLLLKFDSTNRAHADVILKGYRPCEIWPSKWMDEEGLNGAELLEALAEKWNK